MVDEGRYTTIRLDIEEVKIKVVDEEDYHYAKVPSEKIKLVGTFVVPENGVTEVTLDFNGEKSVLVTGNGEYHFKPVIKLLASEPMGLETRGNDAIAEWTDEIEPGNYSVKLYVGDGGADMATVVEGEFPTGLTATDTDWVVVDAITEMKW